MGLLSIFFAYVIFTKFSGIRTHIVGVEGEYAEYWTTTTTTENGMIELRLRLKIRNDT